MLNRISIIFMLLCMFVLSSLYCEDIRVMTFNIRYNNAGDGINTWQNRKELVRKLYTVK